MKALYTLFLLFTAAALSANPAGKPERLFDGKTVAGWEGSSKWFRVEDGAIVGGSMTEPIPQNEFLCTTREFGDFDLTLKFKVTGEEANAGVQVRSRRVPNSNEVSGYQADLGDGWWGSLYDEARRNRLLVKADEKVVERALKRGGWNDYRILCEGRRVRLYINGAQTVDYTEPDESIPLSGIIGLQIHAGKPSEASYKEIVIRPLGPPAEKHP